MSITLHHGGRRGFTLIEVLVAMALLGIGLGALFELFSGGLRSARISEEYTKATWYGKARMEEILSGKDFSEGTTEGTFESGYAWTSEVKRATPASSGQKEGDDSDLPVDLFQISVRVTWTSGTRERSLELESFRAFEKKEE
jgi:general secretion pathway protein I